MTNDGAGMTCKTGKSLYRLNRVARGLQRSYDIGGGVGLNFQTGRVVPPSLAEQPARARDGFLK